MFQMDVISSVAEVMKKVGEERWGELEKRLAEGTGATLDPELGMKPLGADQAAELVGEACTEIERERNITQTRQNLHLHIDKAQQVIHEALWDVQFLSGLGDVEYEGGDADTEHCLNEALRQLRLAQAIKPTDKDGN
jgi:hypothetical protein